MTEADIRRLPKAVLHDHLDGGLRPATVLELADAAGYRGLPGDDAAALASWFHQGEAGSLERYLAAFAHTVAVMASPAAIARVAHEAAVDLAADGVVYAEVRFGPGLHRGAGMAPEDAIEAALDGLNRGRRETGLAIHLIVTALRQERDSEDIARAAARFAGAGVVGFDLAGPEAGHPPDEHLAACRRAAEAGLGLTIHAGEAAGPDGIWRAVARCGARRVGHGVRIVDDMRSEAGEVVKLGALARRIRDHRIPLEVAPTSNLQIGAFPDRASHPFGLLHRGGFAVTLNTDNRLMSDVTVTDEYLQAHLVDGLSLADLGTVTETALEAGFGDWPERRRLIEDVVRPAYAS